MKIVISSGDPAGCGSLITLKAIEVLHSNRVQFFVTGDKEIFHRFPLFRRVKKYFSLIDLKTNGLSRLRIGFPSRLSGEVALSYLKKALYFSRQQKIYRLVTAPVSKEAVQMVLPGFFGHTEYLADSFGVKNIAMMMVSSRLRTVLLTRHILLKEVGKRLNINNLADTFFLVCSSLERAFGIKRPKVAVAAVNPHAGINTYLAREEQIIKKAILKSHLSIEGPYPADTLFIKSNLEKFDCIFCTYHDQGMVPFKLLSFQDGVNLTLGLPIIRTSPAHGVAYDLMRSGKTPSHLSMVEAIRLAIRLKISSK